MGVGARNHQLFESLPPHRAGLPHGRCPVTGVGGFVLGGGFGFTSRSMGTLSDTLVSTQIITADGSLLTCDAANHSDLYWACRGGAGGSFGINTSYTLQTHPLPATVSVYHIEWPWSEAASAVKALQAMMLHAPDQLGCRIGMGATGLAHKKFSMDTLGEYVGPVKQLRELLSPVLAAAKPASVMIKELPLKDAVLFVAANVPFDRFASKSSYAIDAFSDAALSPSGKRLLQWGGTGTARGRFISATGLAVDRRGHVYVADYGNNRIQKFTAGGRFIAAWR